MIYGVNILIVIISNDFLGLRARTCNSADTSSHAEHEGKNFRCPHDDRPIDDIELQYLSL